MDTPTTAQPANATPPPTQPETASKPAAMRTGAFAPAGGHQTPLAAKVRRYTLDAELGTDPVEPAWFKRPAVTQQQSPRRTSSARSAAAGR